MASKSSMVPSAMIRIERTQSSLVSMRVVSIIPPFCFRRSVGPAWSFRSCCRRLAWRRTRLGVGVRYHAELVAANPVLHGLAVFEAVDVDFVCLDPPARGRDAHERPLVGAGEGAAQHNPVALHDDLLDLVAVVREGCG